MNLKKWFHRWRTARRQRALVAQLEYERDLDCLRVAALAFHTGNPVIGNRDEHGNITMQVLGND